MSEVHVVWIDDDFEEKSGDRHVVAGSLENESNGQLRFTRLIPKDVISWLESIEDDSNFKCDIILVDVFLQSSNAGKAHTPVFFRHGTEIIGFLSTNNKLHDVPKYLVSRGFKEEQTKRQTDLVDWIISHDQLTCHGSNILLQDATDYRRLREIFPQHLTDQANDINGLAEQFIALLNSPDISKELLTQSSNIFLRELLNKNRLDNNYVNYGNENAVLSQHLSLDAARWIRSSLLKRSGPVINDLSAATSLGLKLNVFVETVSKVILEENPQTQYSGIFHTSENRRWWKDALIDWALSKFDDLPISPKSEFKRMLCEHLQINENDQAVCSVCKEKWPDGLASDSDDPSEIRPVHWRCSTAIDEPYIPVGFDELREFTN